MRKLIVAAMIAAAIPLAPAAAQTVPATVADPSPIADRFFEVLKRGGGAAEALDSLTPSASWLKRGEDKFELVRAQMEKTLAGYGPVMRWERVASEPLGTLARRDTYLVQHRDMVVRWRIVYVKLDKIWIVGHLGFEDQAQTWFN